MEEIKSFLHEVYNEVKEEKSGNVADYIPELGKVNPELFGITACSVDGKIVEIGDTDVNFCLQSCSKPLNYCIAREKLGKHKIHSHVGYEPSGQAFNAHVLNKNGLPHNPMINAGAIMVASLLESDEEPANRFNVIKKYYQEMSGNIGNIGFDNSIFLSEKQHADRNVSLAYFMRENGAFSGNISPHKIQEHLDLYFQACSITIDSKIGSVICSTLANGGVCPITSKKVFSTETVRDCLALMYGCGMYDYSGQFSFEIGLPAKSGVSGCIFLVIPNVMGLCIYSPLLDDIGNSVRGIKICKKIVEKFNYHIFENIVKNANLDFGKQSEEVLIQKMINCASNNNLNTLQELSELIDLDKSDYDKRTAIHLACAEGHYDIVKFLIDKGCSVNVKDRWGNTPLSEISNKKGDNFRKIEELILSVKTIEK